MMDNQVILGDEMYLKCKDCDYIIDHPDPWPNRDGFCLCPMCFKLQSYKGWSEW